MAWTCTQADLGAVVVEDTVNDSSVIGSTSAAVLTVEEHCSGIALGRNNGTFGSTFRRRSENGLCALVHRMSWALMTIVVHDPTCVGPGSGQRTDLYVDHCVS